jgi:hypothetical protein
VLVREKNYDFKMWPQKRRNCFYYIQTSDGGERRKKSSLVLQFNRGAHTVKRLKSSAKYKRGDEDQEYLLHFFLLSFFSPLKRKKKFENFSLLVDRNREEDRERGARDDFSHFSFLCRPPKNSTRKHVFHFYAPDEMKKRSAVALCKCLVS